MLARVHEGIVVEVATAVAVAAEDPEYTAAFPGTWITAPDGVATGWTYDGETWTNPAETLVVAQAIKRAHAAAYLAGLIEAGLTYSGKVIQIDPASQANLAAMALLAFAVPDSWPDDFSWVTSDNSRLPLNATQMVALAAAAASYVSKCVLRLRAIKDAITAASDLPALAAIDVTTGYPGA